MIKFLYTLNRVILYSGFISLACCLLYLVAVWNLHSLKESVGVIERVFALTVISYVIQRALSHFLFDPIDWDRAVDDCKDKTFRVRQDNVIPHEMISTWRKAEGFSDIASFHTMQSDRRDKE